MSSQYSPFQKSIISQPWRPSNSSRMLSVEESSFTDPCLTEISSTALEQYTYDRNLWWEREAEKVVRNSQDPVELRLVCLLAPHHDQQSLRLAVLERWNPLAHKFLAIFRENNDWKQEWTLDGNLKPTKSPPSCPASGDLQWTAPRAFAVMDAGGIAEAFDKEICAVFCRVPFEDWVRAALGYTSHSVTRLVDGVSGVRQELAQYFTELHQPVEKYKLIKKVRCIIFI